MLQAIEDSPEEQPSASPHLEPCINSDDSSSEYNENFLDDVYDEDSWSSDSDYCTVCYPQYTPFSISLFSVLLWHKSIWFLFAQKIHLVFFFCLGALFIYLTCYYVFNVGFMVFLNIHGFTY